MTHNNELEKDKKLLEMIPSIKAIDVIDNEDGSANLVFDVDSSFIDFYKKLYNLEEWDQDHFQNTILKAIEDMLDREEKRIQQDPDFLWNLPKDNDE